MKMSGLLIAVAIIVSSACLSNSNSDNTTSETNVILDTLESPGESITGLAWGDGFLWAVDSSLDRIFRIDTTTGEIIDSFKCSTPSSFTATGLAFSEEHNLILLGLWNHSSNAYVYFYSPGGEYIGSVSMCGG
ncbi:MAG: hypothetical protein K8S24_03535 [Candidatus Aegiribacteria sp.]|nr:hypothetical protein [Candidatus Aegiribacteria sp.]